MDRKQKLKQLTKDIESKLEQIGDKLGFKSKREWNIKGGRIDLVWYKEIPINLPKLEINEIPIVGFEIETSWRQHKLIKADLLNLTTLSPALGILIFLEEGYTTKGLFDKEKDFPANMKLAEGLAKDFELVSRLIIWSKEEVDKLYNNAINLD